MPKKHAIECHECQFLFKLKNRIISESTCLKFFMYVLYIFHFPNIWTTFFFESSISWLPRYVQILDCVYPSLKVDSILVVLSTLTLVVAARGYLVTNVPRFMESLALLWFSTSRSASRCDTRVFSTCHMSLFFWCSLCLSMYIIIYHYIYNIHMWYVTYLLRVSRINELRGCTPVDGLKS